MTDHTAAIAAMIAAIDAQPTTAANERMKIVMEILLDIINQLDGTQGEIARLDNGVRSWELSQDAVGGIIADVYKRLHILEAWRRTMTGDGR